MDINEIKNLKNKRKITMLTAYDYPTAELVDKAGIDIILVGDSLANVVLGLDSTTKVGMAEMLHHAKAVTRAAKNSLVVGDMPYDSYQVNPVRDKTPQVSDGCLRQPVSNGVNPDAVKNAQRFITEAGCQAIKLEWFARCLEVTGQIVSAGIPVMGHIGLTPQTVDKIGGFKVQGRDAQAAQRLINQAIGLQEKGCFAIVLECVPDKIAELITRKLKIPTIGIGAGIHCDGQVLVIHDMLGLFARYTPKFVKKYADLSPLILKAVEGFKNEVTHEKFPGLEHSFSIKEEELKKINGG